MNTKTTIAAAVVFISFWPKKIVSGIVHIGDVQNITDAVALNLRFIRRFRRMPYLTLSMCKSYLTIAVYATDDRPTRALSRSVITNHRRKPFHWLVTFFGKYWRPAWRRRLQQPRRVGGFISTDDRLSEFISESLAVEQKNNRSFHKTGARTLVVGSVGGWRSNRCGRTSFWHGLSARPIHDVRILVSRRLSGPDLTSHDPLSP